MLAVTQVFQQALAVLAVMAAGGAGAGGQAGQVLRVIRYERIGVVGGERLMECESPASGCWRGFPVQAVAGSLILS